MGLVILWTSKKALSFLAVENLTKEVGTSFEIMKVLMCLGGKCSYTFCPTWPKGSWESQEADSVFMFSQQDPQQ